MRDSWRFGTIFLVLALGSAPAGEAAQVVPPEPPLAAGIDALTSNVWHSIKPDFKLPSEYPDAQLSPYDGFSTNVYRSRTGTVLIRTGLTSKAAGWGPGYYSNAFMEWDLKANSGKVVDVFTWGGGSYGDGRLLDSFQDRPSPSPRHTYDCLAYVESEDAVYFIGSTSYRMFITKGELSEEGNRAKEACSLGERSTWRFSCAEKKWTRIETAPWKTDTTALEAHLVHWPEGGKLLFAYHAGKCAEFDLKTRQWTETFSPKNIGAMSLYESRSTWDGKRQRWVFRRGTQLCSYDPAAREYTLLPGMFPAPSDKKDPLNNTQSIAYNSKHDAYVTTGPTANDTWVFYPETSQWKHLRGGETKLPPWAYLKYDPLTDTMVLNYQLKTYVLRYTPAK